MQFFLCSLIIIASFNVYLNLITYTLRKFVLINGAIRYYAINKKTGGRPYLTLICL